MSDDESYALRLTNVSRRFGSRDVLSNVTLSVPAGKITCLLGESGCGKSTLLRLISGVDRPDRGMIEMAGVEIAGPSRFVEPEDRKIGFMFQDFALFPHLDVTDNLSFGLRALSRSEQDVRVTDVVERIGIEHLADRFPHSLSGGEQQRVALARALAPEPDILLMDEPFSNLDQGLRERVRKETVDTLRKIETTAIMVTHDPQEALAVGDLIVLMRNGAIEQIGSPFDIYDRPASPYAAEFMGPCNRLTGIWSEGAISTPIGRFHADLDIPDGSMAMACIRPQALTLGPDGDGISARIIGKTFMGESEQIDISVHPLAEPLRVHHHERIAMAVGEKVGLRLNGAQVHVFADFNPLSQS
ncbi:ABC transporter ATP-binding protein [Qingshengfaniella alkalisoli]|uniref:ABC transporter ATP-binding protein n=1 Tax=Qingshengfaniella alkalisoli TaxID=2599296 RepID=A0A5B8J0A6_9RHOB|nr:ABC transporter ATP-binding protein [Qingshengfaniella alkalisoli]QDY71334.1 ABC transporter ATP-binding protein [Qingshengfaniella alkalisoli]